MFRSTLFDVRGDTVMVLIKDNEQNLRVLLDIAREDLSVSKLLYLKRRYRYSIFFLQQSVEKTLKYIYSIGKLGNDVNYDESEKKFIENCKKLGHKVSNKLLKEMNVILDEIREYVDSNFKETTLLRPGVKFLTDTIEIFSNQLKENPEKITEKAIIKLFIRFDNKNFRQIYRKIQSINFLKKFESKVYHKYKNTIIAFDVCLFFHLILLDFLLNEHARYPQKGFNPCLYYSKNPPLVSNLKKIINIYEKILDYYWLRI